MTLRPPQNISWPSEKAQLIDLINSKVQACLSGNPVLMEFVNANLQPLLDALPENWTETPTSHVHSDPKS